MLKNPGRGPMARQTNTKTLAHDGARAGNGRGLGRPWGHSLEGTVSRRTLVIKTGRERERKRAGERGTRAREIDLETLC